MTEKSEKEDYVLQRLRPRRPRSRGAALTELVLGLPVLVFFLLLAFEVSRVAMIQGQLNSVTHDAARRAAAIGIAGEGGSCADMVGGGNYALEEFCNGVGDVISASGQMYDTAELTVNTPGYYAGQRVCRSDFGDNDRIEVSTSAEVNFAMPLLSDILQLVGGTGEEVDTGDWTVRANAVSACEVAR